MVTSQFETGFRSCYFPFTSTLGLIPEHPKVDGSPLKFALIACWIV